MKILCSDPQKAPPCVNTRLLMYRNVKIGSTAWALGPWKDFAYKEERNKNNYIGYMGRSNLWGDLDHMWRVERYGGRNHVCNIWWLSVKGCGRGARGNFALSHWLDASPLQHWSHYRVTVWYTSTNGVVIPLAAQCGCQICLPSVFGNNGEPILPYCQHFHALHRNTATRSVSQHKASNFHKIRYPCFPSLIDVTCGIHLRVVFFATNFLLSYAISQETPWGLQGRSG